MVAEHEDETAESLARKWDEEYTTWIRENAGRLRQTAYFITGDHGMADDAAHDAAVKIRKVWPDEEKRRQIETNWGYVKSIIQNANKDWHKRASRSNRNEDALPVGFENSARLQSRIGDPESSIQATDTRQAISRFLDEDERHLIHSRYYEGYGIAEAGRIIGLTDQQAYKIHTRALRKLEKHLESSEEEG